MPNLSLHDALPIYSGLEFAVCSVLGPCRKNGEQVTLDQIRFVDASGNIHAVRLFIVESNPSFKITQDLESVVSELVAAIVVGTDTSKLQLSVRKLTLQTLDFRGRLTAETRLVMCARTSGCTISVEPSANSMIAIQ